MELDFIETKRKNYSKFEVQAFWRCCAGFEDIIANKNTQTAVNQAKAKAWEAITARYNSIPGVGKRTSEQLHNLYKNVKKRRKNKEGRVQIFVKTDKNPMENLLRREPSNATDNKLRAMGAMVKIFDSVYANPETLTSETTQSENSLDRRELPEILEVRSNEEAVYLKDIDLSDFSSFDVPTSFIPKVTSQSSLQSSGQEIPPVPSPTNLPNGTTTPGTFVHKLKDGKKQISESDKEDSSSCDVEKQILIEQHEWNWERFNMEKEKGSIEKEKQLLEMKMMKEQLRMYELINEKIEKGEGINICVNINR